MTKSSMWMVLVVFIGNSLAFNIESDSVNRIDFDIPTGDGGQTNLFGYSTAFFKKLDAAR